MYRNQITKTKDGQKIWAAIQTCQLADKITEEEMSKLSQVVQKLQAEDENYSNGVGKYDQPMDLAPGQSERGVVSIRALYNTEREHLFKSIDAILGKYQAWNEAAYVKRQPVKPDPAEAAYAELVDVVNRKLDAVNTLYQSYQEGLTDLTGPERADWRNECFKVLDQHCVNVASASSSVIARYPHLEQKAAMALKDWTNITTGHRKIYLDAQESPQVVFESWEDYLPADTVSYSIPDMSATEVREKMLGNTKVVTPFYDESVTIAQSASHPVMHATRVAAAMMMYMNAAKKARAILQHNPQARPVVFDMGAGAFGGEKLALLKRDPRNSGLFVHASIPSADQEDIHRTNRLRDNPDFMNWNDVSVSHRANQHRINWCRHKARHCTCMRHYTHVFVVCIHSAYYFTQADFDRIFEHTSSFESLEHIPEVGVPIPLHNPEYIWEDASEQSTVVKLPFLGRLANSIRTAVSGTRQVRLQPVVTAASTYVHADTSQRIQNGGFHPNRWARVVDSVLETDGKMAAFATGVAAAGAIGGLIGSIGGSTLASVAASVKGAVSSLALTTTAAYLAKLDTRLTRPWLPGDFSVEVSIASTYETPGNREQLCHIIRYFKTERGAELVPRVTSAVRIDEDQVSRAVAAMSTAADTERTERMVAATLLRDKLPVRVVKGRWRSMAGAAGVFCLAPLQ